MLRNADSIIIKKFNGHIENSVNGFEGVHNGYGCNKKKQDDRVLKLADSSDMIVENIYFKMM